MWRIFPLAMVAAIACRPHQPAASARQRVCTREPYELDTTMPCVVGHIVDAATGRPVGRAEIEHSWHGWLADSDGSFAFWSDTIGVVTLQASRIDYAPSSRVATIVSNHTTSVDFVLRRLPPPCCRLLGQWHIAMGLDSANTMARRPTARHVEGEIGFGPNIPNPDPAFNIAPPDDSAPQEYGRFRIDFGPFFGGPVAPDVSRTIFGGEGGTLLTEAEGVIVTGDSLYIMLIPRMTHGSIWLTGRIHGDSIGGQWVQNAYCCGARGHFTMRRTSHDPLVVHDPPPPTPPPAAPSDDRSTWGKARVHIWEESQGRYVVLGHELEYPDGARQSIYHTGGGPDGWGKTIELKPGRYGVIITDFPCGTKDWFLRKEFVQRFTVAKGRLTDVTIRVNLRHAPAADSFDNRRGAPCTQSIGFPPWAVPQ